MSTFNVTVLPLTIVPHPNADRLDLAVVGDFRSVVSKGAHQTGDLGVYIPEAAVLPEALIERMGMTGKLAGPEHNRVQAVRLRSELSQGIVFPLVRDGDAWVLHDPFSGAQRTVQEGDDVTEFLGIVKYEPTIPECLSGSVYNLGMDLTITFDVENVKRFPNVFQDGEAVVMTEKVHGVFVMLGYFPPAFITHHGGHPDNARQEGIPGEGFVSSKGLSALGLVFNHHEDNADNLYVRAFRENNVLEAMARVFGDATQPVLLLGEIFGSGVQDLAYGQRDGRIALRVFDVVHGTRSQAVALNDADLDLALAQLGFPRVPVLYRGPYTKDELLRWTSGHESVTGHNAHLREGVVIKPVIERRDPVIGRVLLKSVSPAYLLRKGHTTEYS